MGVSSNGAAQLTERASALFREHGAKAETIVVRHGRDLTPIARRYAEGGCRPSSPPVATEQSAP